MGIVWEAYRRDHNGQAPKGDEWQDDLLPYLPPGERFRKAIDDYKREHNDQPVTNILDLAAYLQLYIRPTLPSKPDAQ